MKPFYRFREGEARAPRRKPTSISELLIKSLPFLFYASFPDSFFRQKKTRANEKTKQMTTEEQLRKMKRLTETKASLVSA